MQGARIKDQVRNILGNSQHAITFIEKPPACRRLSWTNIAGEKAFTSNKSTLGAKPVSLVSRPFRSRKRSTPSKRARTRSASRTLNVNYTAKIRRLPKRPRCWCCEKSSTTTGGRRRGQLTSLPEQQLLVAWLTEAIAAGTRKARACQEDGLALSPLQRWTHVADRG
ncbi:hypothetical protein [Pseudomonas synxantha]|nr:hypothetical protein [Pseudomonas synxantha]